MPKFCKIHLYADDIQLFLSFPPCEVLRAQEQINHDLNEIYKWTSSNSLLINTKKCHNILFGTSHKLSGVSLQITINNEEIEYVDKVNNLGVIFDSELTFSSHVSHICRECYLKFRQLIPLKHILNGKTKLLLMNSLILSRLNYCDQLYGPCLTINDKAKLQKIQNNCIRFITNVPFGDHITPYLRSFGLLKMNEQRCIHYSCFLNSVLKEHAPVYLYDKILKRSQVHSRKLRFVDAQLDIPSHKMSMFKTSFSYLASYVFNKCPELACGYSNFNLKNKINKQILTNNFNIDTIKF